jgi:hypothetical protein
MSIGMVAGDGRRVQLSIAVLALSALFLSWSTTASRSGMALPGQFSVSPTGGATYSIPIALPPGTAGMMPGLSLNYSSQSGNGALGVGWTLSGLPVITRCPRTLAQDGALGGVNFDANDRFCMNGQRLVAISGTYGADGTQYRTEIESYSKVISRGTAGNGPAWFEVHTKSGQIMEFGNTSNSRILAQGKTSARVWAVNKVGDSKSNYYAVTYYVDAANGQYYPTRIDYTGNSAAGVSPYNSVVFGYDARPDVIQQYHAGSLVQTAIRMREVRTFAGATLISDYRLTYQQSGSANRSRITSITACDGGGACLPATNFNWTNVAASFGSYQSWNTYYTTGAGWINQNTNPRMLVDVNGDGLPDIVGIGSGAVAVSLNTGTSFGAPQQWSTQFATGSGWTNQNTYPRMLVDVNGDGLPDIVGFGRDAVFVALNTGTSFGSYQSWNTYYTTGAGWIDQNTNPRMLVDVNGDGLPDIVGFGPGAVAVSLNTGTSFGSQQIWSTQFTTGAGWIDQNVNPRMLVDVNGDGLPDLVGFGGGAVVVSLNTGTSFSGYQLWSTQFTTGAGWVDQNVNPRTLVDVNGDGLPDLVGFGAGAVVVSYNTGNSFSGYQIWSTQFTTGAGWTDQKINPRMLVDLNGIGFPSVVGFGNGAVPVSPSAASGPLPDLLSSVVNGLGMTTSITYSPATNSSVVTKGTGTAFPMLNLAAPIYVVSRVDASNGIGGTHSSTRSYMGGRIDTRGRGFLGFAQAGVKDLQTNIVQTTTYRQDFPYIGATDSAKAVLGSLTLSQTTNTYQFSNASSAAAVSTPSVTSAPYRVSVAQSVAQSSDLDGAALPTVTSTYQYDAFNNATQVVSSTTDGFTSTTANTYSNDTTNWFLGRLTRASVTRTVLESGEFCALPWGATIASGQSVTAYSAINPPAGQACSTIAQTRTCTAGTLGGSATQQSCVALCALPWGSTISAGQTVTAYSAASVPSPQVCSSVAQTRTCGADGILSGSFVNQSCTVRLPQTLYLTSGSSWTVPSDWSNAANKIEVIGGGGGGIGGGGTGNGGGGGGGGYSSVTNLTLTPGLTVSYNVGLGGTAATAGGNTWFNGGSVSAQGGGAGGSPGGGSGGQASNGIGTIKYSGGSGGNGGIGGGGGGGAAGPHGNGGAGGSYAGGVYSGGGGGGGADGGTPGGNDNYAVSGAGGNGWQGTGGWAGNCISGSNGTGAGGSGGYGGDYGNPNHVSPGYGLTGFDGCGGNGAMDTAFDASHGSGGGGGGGGSNWNINHNSTRSAQGYPGGAGASFGGGGGGGGAANASGGLGGNGLIVITYTSAF